MAKICAIVARLLLAPSECHELLKHTTALLHINYCACLSVAGDKAEFLYSTFADLATIQEPLTGTKHDQNGVIGYLPESQDNCDSSGGLLRRPKLRWLLGKPPFQGPSDTRKNNMEDLIERCVRSIRTIKAIFSFK
jgi:hypothetical protein